MEILTSWKKKVALFAWREAWESMEPVSRITAFWAWRVGVAESFLMSCLAVSKSTAWLRVTEVVGIGQCFSSDLPFSKLCSWRNWRHILGPLTDVSESACQTSCKTLDIRRQQSIEEECWLATGVGELTLWKSKRPVSLSKKAQRQEPRKVPGQQLFWKEKGMANVRVAIYLRCKRNQSHASKLQCWMTGWWKVGIRLPLIVERRGADQWSRLTCK